MALTEEGQDAAADGVATAFPWLALFDGDPEGAGTELSGGSPAYARLQGTWPSASSGATTASNTPLTFDIPAGADVSHVAWFSAVTAGTRGGSVALAATESYAAQGEFDLNTATIDPLAT